MSAAERLLRRTRTRRSGWSRQQVRYSGAVPLSSLLLFSLLLAPHTQAPTPALTRAIERQIAARDANSRGDAALARALAREGIEVLEAEGAPAEGEAGWPWAQTLERLGSEAATGGDLELSARAHERALFWGEASRERDDLWILRTRGNLARAWKRLGRLEEALLVEEELVQAFDRTLAPEAVERVIGRINLTETLGMLGRFDEMAVPLEEAQELASRLGAAGVPLLETVEMNLATVAFRHGDLREARELLEGVVARREQRLPPEHPALLRALGNLASILAAEGREDGSRETLLRVVDVFTRIYAPEHPELLWARAALARRDRDAGDLAAARAILEDVVARQEALLPEDHPDLLRNLLDLASTLRLAGEAERARQLVERVLAARESHLEPDHPDVVATRMELSQSMLEDGDAEGALMLAQGVVAARERALGEDDPQRWAAQRLLASALAGLGRHEEALALRERVLEAYERILAPGSLERFNVMNGIAGGLELLGRHEEALARFEALVAQAERRLPRGHLGRINARLNLATSLDGAGRSAAALEALRACAAEVDELPAGDRRRRGLHYGLALLLWREGDLAAARIEALRLADEIEAALAAASVLAPREARAAAAGESTHLALVLTLCAEGAAGRRAFEIAESVRALALAPPPAPDDAEGERLLAELVRTRARLAGELPDDSAPDQEGGLAELALRRDGLERALRARAHAQGAAFDPVDADALAARLPEGVAVLTYLRTPLLQPGESVDAQAVDVLRREERLLAHVLRADGALARVDLGPAAELDERIAGWRAALGSPLVARGSAVAAPDPRGPEELAALGAELRRKLVDPLLAEAGGARALRVVADSSLFLVPLDALPLEEGGALGDRMQIVLVPVLLPPRPARSEARGRLVALGGVDYDAAAGRAPLLAAASFSPPLGLLRSGAEGALAPLPGTEAELSALRAVAERAGIECLELEGAAATKAALFEAAGGARWVHLATHGWFLGAEGRGAEARAFAPLLLCGLALAGANRSLEGERDALGRVPGLVTAEELCSLDLSACSLAVLSACETNVGVADAGRGIQSLQAALLVAGARTALASLWKVDDDAARELMERFYAGLWDEGLGPGEALWRAKSALRASGRPPRDWAGWVLSAASP